MVDREIAPDLVERIPPRISFAHRQANRVVRTVCTVGALIPACFAIFRGQNSELDP